jgi:hypothetical protein
VQGVQNVQLCCWGVVQRLQLLAICIRCSTAAAPAVAQMKVLLLLLTVLPVVQAGVMRVAGKSTAGV